MLRMGRTMTIRVGTLQRYDVQRYVSEYHFRDIKFTNFMKNHWIAIGYVKCGLYGFPKKKSNLEQNSERYSKSSDIKSC